jgi:hypothetical protein
MLKYSSTNTLKGPHFAWWLVGHHKCVKNQVAKRPHFAWQPPYQLDITTVSKNHVTKCPHFSLQLVGHHKSVLKSCDQTSTFFSIAEVDHHRYVQSSCDDKSTSSLAAGRTSQMCPKFKRQNVHTLPDSWLVIRNVSRNPVTKRPHFTWQQVGHHKYVQKSCDEMSTFR